MTRTCKNDSSHKETKVVISKNLKYSLSDGEYLLGSSKEVVISITCDDPNAEPYLLDFFTGLKIDGKTLTAGIDYTAERSSVKITVKPSYTETLKAGKYPVEAAFSNGAVSGTLTVKGGVSAGDGAVPSTSDTDRSNTLLSAIIQALLALGALTYAAVSGRLGRARLSAVSAGNIDAASIYPDCPIGYIGTEDELEDIEPDTDDL